ncbi:MAG: YSIRK-type signal peptide-containing protein [Cyclonatronaceae bacterium]
MLAHYHFRKLAAGAVSALVGAHHSVPAGRFFIPRQGI